MSEERIIKRLVESRQETLLEARRNPIDIFFAQLEGTYNRLVAINKRYNTKDQQKIVDEYLSEPLKFLVLNKDVIKAILETPKGAPTGVDLKKYLFECEELEGERLDEGRTGLDMYFSELDELAARANYVTSRLNDAEQAKEFDGIVMKRVNYLMHFKRETERIMKADPDADLKDVVKLFKSKKPQKSKDLGDADKAKKAMAERQKMIDALGTVGFNPNYMATLGDDEIKRSYDYQVSQGTINPSADPNASKLEKDIQDRLFRLSRRLGRDGKDPVRKSGSWWEASFRDYDYFTSRPGEEDDDWPIFSGYREVKKIAEEMFRDILSKVTIEIMDDEKSWYRVLVQPKK